MKKNFSWIGASLIVLSTIGGILYNIKPCNEEMGKLFWKHQRKGLEKLSSLGNGFNHRTLTAETDGDTYHAWLKLMKEFAPYEPFEGVRAVESKTILNYSTQPNQTSVPLLSAPVSLLYENKDEDHVVTTLPVIREWLRNREGSDFFGILLGVFLLGFIVEFFGREKCLQFNEPNVGKTTTRVLFSVSTVILCLFLIVSYLWLHKLNLVLAIIPWLGWAFFLIFLFANSAWRFIENENKIDRRMTIIDIKTENRDVHLNKYDHVHDEVTRYRDLVWKIGALTWGIYYGLVWLFKEASEVFYLPKVAFFFPLFLAAGISSIFLLFCEHSTIANKRQRRELEENLNLSSRWRHTPEGEKTNRLGFRFSLLAFFLAVWLPPLIMLAFIK